MSNGSDETRQTQGLSFPLYGVDPALSIIEYRDMKSILSEKNGTPPLYFATYLCLFSILQHISSFSL